MSLAIINKNKEEHTKIKKRKFSTTKDESAFNHFSANHKAFKKMRPAEDSLISVASKGDKGDAPKVFHFKSTDAYTKIVANPGSLPCTPKIFQTKVCKNEASTVPECFLIDLMTVKSMNRNVNERFNNICVPHSKKKKLKGKKEDILEEKCKESFVNKEKNVENKLKTKEEKDLPEANDTSEDEKNLNEASKNINKKVNIYKVVEKKALIFHLHHPFKFSFHGEVRVTVITGEVEIFGYTLSKNSVNAYSPDFCAPLTVETKVSKESEPVEEIKHRLKDILSEGDCNAVLTEIKQDDSVILVEPVMSTFGVVINKYFDRPLFPKDLEDVSSETETLKSLQSIFSFNLSEKGKHFRKSPEWDKIPLGQITALCGGKGVGKSTLLKYYINKLVTFGEKVLCLDFDPGQPEFTYPGCLSAVIIDQPLLGPNFTHVMDPILMMSFGDVDVCSNPSKYLECVNFIIQSCRKNEELLKMKWFINTMGFCKGLGINLMITILKLLQPSTVIQIKSSDCKNNYPIYLTPITVNSKSGFRSMPSDGVTLSYDLRVIQSCAEYKKKQLQGGLKPRQLRDIMAISYFSRMVSPPFYNFNAVQPFLIPFSRLYLGIDFMIDPKDVLKAFNGSTVSLSHFQPDNEDILSAESKEDVYFKVVVKPTVAPSLGIGFVRGIDCQTKTFYIMTHLPVDVLENVNCLCLGRVSPPHSIFIKQETVEGPAVYTTMGTLNTVQRVKRMFRVPGNILSKGKISE